MQDDCATWRHARPLPGKVKNIPRTHFTATLEKYSLLVDNRATITLASGENLALSGFRVIDEKKFMALPDDVFLDWRQRGWIPMVYCHLLSMGNWQSLADNIGGAEDGDNTS